MTINLPGPGEALFTIGILIGIPFLLLLPAYLINWAMGWIKAAASTIRVGTEVVDAAGRLTRRTVSTTWVTLLSMALAVLCNYMLFRMVDDFVYERFLNHQLDWPGRVAYLFTMTPAGYTANTAGLIGTGLAIAWIGFTFGRNRLGASLAEAAAAMARWCQTLMAVLCGFLGVLGLGLFVVCSMASPTFLLDDPDWAAIFTGSLQLLILAGLSIATAGAIVLVSGRLEDV